MQFDIRFKGIGYSRSLVEYTEGKFAKLEKFEIKPITVNVTFRAERYNKMAEVYVKGLNSPFRAKGAGETYLDALDAVLRRLWRQMAREKSKVKRHKNRKKSKYGQLEARLQLERALKRAA